MRMLCNVVRTRTVREGSVGLLILLGIVTFAGLLLWLRGVSLGRRSYKVVVEFANVGGMQEGAVVRYRGFQVGKISDIQPKPNGVEVNIEITPADLIIPRDVLVEANQSGLISEVGIDITPQKTLPSSSVVAKPLDQNCDQSLIVCDGSRLQGRIGISTEELFRATSRFANVYGDPRLYNNFSTAAENAAVAAAAVTRLTRDLSSLTKATQQQLGSVSATASSVQRAANQITVSTNKTVTQLGATVDQIRLTTAQADRLLADLDSLVTTNQTAISTTLNNLSQTSGQLRVVLDGLAPTLNRVTQGELIQNLETLSANAAQASANLRDASNTLNSPTNLLVLQQTLDSARVTFQNAQKITSDLDELTGDPNFRDNVRQLVNGLSGLVSSTQQLEQQIYTAQTLDSVTAAVKSSEAGVPTGSNDTTPVIPTLNSAALSALGESYEPPDSSVKTPSKLMKLLTPDALNREQKQP